VLFEDLLVLVELVLLLSKKDIGNECCGVLEGVNEAPVLDPMLEKVVGDSEMSDKVCAVIAVDELTEVSRAKIATGREARLTKSESVEYIAIFVNYVRCCSACL
jgi:hypothetical protein